jgi:predicted N-acetyltransferase YhbS
MRVYDPELGPWLGDLVVDPMYQKQGIGTMLVNAVIKKAKDMGYRKLYLFTFDPSIPNYYERLGWKKVGMDQFKSQSVIVMEISL